MQKKKTRSCHNNNNMEGNFMIKKKQPLTITLNLWIIYLYTTFFLKKDF